MDNKDHEILPSPQVPPEQQQPPREAAEVNGADHGVPESEEAASKVVEAPSFGSTPPQAPPPPTQTDQSSANVAANDNQALPPVDSTQSSATQSSAPQIADDVDLIEKEWVNKAKEIVEQTKDDPYNQNREIVRLRADYMKKRYNKDIKLIKD